MSSIMESITDYMAQCPLVNPDLPFYLDFVGEKDCYCISTVPNTPYVKDIIGNKTYTVTFQFALRASISDDAQRAENVAFLEAFNRWVDEQNDSRIYPTLVANQTAKSLKVIESGYLDEGDDNHITGVYVTQLQFIYKERKV